MSRTNSVTIEGTPQQLVTRLSSLSSGKRFRLVEVAATQPEPEGVAVPGTAAEASIALLKSWLSAAPTDPTAILDAEQDLNEFKQHMNASRREAGSRLHYQEAPGV